MILFLCVHSDFNFISFLNLRLEFKVKKEGFGGGGTKQVKVINGQDNQAVCKVSGKVMTVSIGPGLPKEARKF